MAATMAVTTMVTKNKENWSLPLPELAFPWNSRGGKNDLEFPRRALFASVGLNVCPGAAAARDPREHDVKARPADNCDVARQLGAAVPGQQAGEAEEEAAAAAATGKKKKSSKKLLGNLRKVRVKIANPHMRRLVSGAVAGAVSRTLVAPLETIRTHLMVGSSGPNSMAGVFRWIMRTEGWTGLFRGNAVNVLRVAPSKAIEHFTYDTAKKFLTPKADEPPMIPIPTPLVAGALAGVTSTLCTYPMELIKTRVTIEKDVYDNVAHAFVKILREEGPSELYRGLAPSLIGVVPYAACNFYAYETLKRLYRRASGSRGDVGAAATLLIGSAAGAIASTATFPLEVARKQMQVGALGGRQVYRNVLHAMYCIVRKEGVGGLYRGLGPSCIKLMPAAGISFMCYEACKKILVDREDEEDGEDVEDDKEKKDA
ncbi:adenine nucleotide transporter BT1, chloroplastic/amyloplastic/mitochondrial-like [Phragmites australis]|uniref:adenine nucleotide transporter BT1, chloroplastic/amyloplastic/mitochondrial-like n=1 Tax=Phragmites australis TaxID=29695 RepID=UPI002D77A22B|nr:adenine nucleotide transporter BT1, chloroplastic/amyloplastic/mitochondrial-like [Phragmites australis]